MQRETAQQNQKRAIQSAERSPSTHNMPVGKFAVLTYPVKTWAEQIMLA